VSNIKFQSIVFLSLQPDQHVAETHFTAGVFIMLARVLLACLMAAYTPLAQSREDEAVQYAQRITTHGKTYLPSAGYVPDAKTAVAIAKAVLIPIYGKAEIDGEEPWHTGLKSGVWTVVGTLNGQANGGSAVVQIDKKTGAIRFVTHTE
jgi:hypothetical protein